LEIFDEQRYRDMHKKTSINIHAKSPAQLYEQHSEQQPVSENMHSDRHGVAHGTATDTPQGTALPEGRFAQRLKQVFEEAMPESPKNR
jgi:hypothetical protein